MKSDQSDKTNQKHLAQLKSLAQLAEASDPWYESAPRFDNQVKPAKQSGKGLRWEMLEANSRT